MQRDTLARLALLRVLQRTTAKALARRLRVYQSTVTRWAVGETLPSERCQEELAAQYGIDRSGWCQPPPGR